MSFLYDTEILAPLARKLSRMATQAYVKSGDGHYQPKLSLPQKAPRADRISDIFERFLVTQPPAQSAKRLDETLRNDGFYHYTYLASGQDGDVFVANHNNGHEYAMRIAEYPKSRDFRAVSPMVVQPFRTHITNWNYVLEVMPLVQILTQSHTTPAANTINTTLSKRDGETLLSIMSQTAMTAGTYCNDFALKDMAILPDGTPIQPDPGQIQYVDAHMHQKPALIHAGLNMLYNTLYARPQPEQFRWITPDGQFKQDIFFKNPYKRKPYHQGFVIKP